MNHNKLHRILQEMGIPDHLTCLLRNLYQKQQLELDMEPQICTKLGKEYIKVVYCHPAILYVEYFMLNPRLEEAQTRIKIVRRNISNLRYAGGTTLIAESEEPKSLLMKVKGE